MRSVAETPAGSSAADGTPAAATGYPGFVAPRVRVGTFVDAPLTLFVILYLTRRWGWKVALASAIIGTAAAPMIFEFPFDLIVMMWTNPPIPTHPMLYRQLFFLP
jgi:hypothetical protein